MAKPSLISREDGNWATLRRLVLRLLETHDGAIDDIMNRLNSGDSRYAKLDEQLKRCIGALFGDTSVGTLRTAIALIQQEQGGIRRELDGVHAKANAAHSKANENSRAIAVLKDGKLPDGEGKASNKVVLGLVAVISALIQGIFKLAEMLFWGK